MKRAINRFWYTPQQIRDWIFHPSVRGFEHPNIKASVYRYPSPGNDNNTDLNQSHYEDYKTPYEHSSYNVRYLNPVPAQTTDTTFEVKVDPPTLTPILKLQRTGLLKKGEEGNVDLLAEAKKKYLEKFGIPVEQNVYTSEDVNIPKNANREEIAAYIQSFYQDVRTMKKTAYDYSMDRKTIDDPEIIPLESVDMYVDPHFQQSRIVNRYLIEEAINENVKKKKIDAYVGDARFWKAIDDSFEPSEVKNVQTHIGDGEPNNFELRKSEGIELQFNADGTVADVHPKL